MTNTRVIGSDAGAADAPPTVENIQALRGIAALLVIWTHLRFPVAALCPSSEISPLLQTTYGAIGVDLFFIISGYVISLTACKRHHRPIDFFLARIARVSPIYLAIIVPQFLRGIFRTWPDIPWISAWNGIFYLPIFDWKQYTLPPLLVGWTLSFEMWFYVVFALLLNVWRPTKVAQYLPLLFLIGAALMTFYHGGWYFPKFIFHPFVLEFALGCIVFQSQKWLRGVIPWFLVAGGLTYLLVFSRNTEDLGWHGALLSARIDLAWMRVLLWGLPMALIVAGMVGLERDRGIVLPGFLVWMGGISYSLYLTHWFIVTNFDKVGQWLGLHNPFLVVVAVVVSCIFAAWLCWRFAEKPLTSRAQQWAKRIARRYAPKEKIGAALKPVPDGSVNP